jgi:opacity protein-like surface antigen
MRMRSCTFGITLALALTSDVVAQTPAGPPPPTSDRQIPGLDVHELLPDIGRIGSQVGAFGGASFAPYETGTGFDVGGFINLPLARAPGGKLSYELFVAFSESTSDPFVATNPIAYVANLAAGASPAAALAGPPQAPFPVKRDVTLNVRLLQVSPFGLKWTFLGKSSRFRPFLAVGGDFVVVITRVDPLRDESLVFTGASPFDDPLIAGLVAQAPELAARGVPSGQGNVELGGHATGGFELRVSTGVSLNLDYRFTQIGGHAHLQTVHAGIGIHW